MSDEKNSSTSGQGAIHLTNLVHALRPNWGVDGIYEHIVRASRQGLGNPYEVSLAAIRAARDPKNITPGIISLPGKHWSVEQDLKAAKDKLAGKYAAPDTNDPRCDDHPEEHFSSCRECAKEKVPMPSDFRKLAGIVPKQPRKRHRSVEEAETGQEPVNNETKPGEGHAA